MVLSALTASGFIPPPTPVNLGVIGVQVLGALTSGLGEFSMKSNAKYSKFAAGMPGIPSRRGMLIIYALGLLVSLFALIAATRAEDPRPRALLVATMLVLHYLKRELEVMLVHRYSGNLDLGTSCAISVFYGLAALGIVHYTPKEIELGSVAAAGAVLFLLGSAGNGFHHWLLASLRSGGRKAASAYVVPNSGLFKLVACPHYLFELVAWLGVALSSHSLFALLNFASMVNYLSGRSYATREWYRSKFDNFPAERKALVPFVF